MNDVHNLQARCIQPPKSFSTSSCKPMRKDKKKSKKLCNFKKIIYLCTRLTAIRFDSLAQQVEHNTFNVGVLGSSPKRITQTKSHLKGGETDGLEFHLRTSPPTWIIFH